VTFVNAPTWIRYAACDASRTAPWPVLSAWLTESEQSALADMRAPARQTQWLWGRWLSKQLIGNATQVENFREIEIITRGEERLGIQPQVKLCGQVWHGSLSISHTESGVLVALSLDEQISLGVDLACDVPQDTQFRSLWFTASEQAWIANDPAQRTGLLWGLKEAVFKASSVQVDGSSHRWTPTEIEIQPAANHGFEATFLGNSLGQLDVHVQSVSRGWAVVVCLPRQIIPLLHASPADRNTSSRRQTVTPTPFTKTPAIAKEFVAEEKLAFALS
jgi:phosphopantetheinyl transferase